MNWQTIESLGDKGQMILAYDDFTKEMRIGNMPKGYAFGLWYKGRLGWNGNSFSQFNPTLWMPQPSIPKTTDNTELKKRYETRDTAKKITLDDL